MKTSNNSQYDNSSRKFLNNLLVLLMLCFVSHQAMGLSLISIKKNMEGIELLKQEEGGGFLAQSRFVEALESDSLNPRIHINLGIAFEVSEEYPRALKAYLSGLRYAGNDEAVQFVSCFNAARMFATLEDIEGALNQYQQCLALRPSSVEVKTNIELLFLGKNGKGKGNGNPSKGKGDGPSDGEIINSRPQKRTFDSKKLSEEDIQRILKEIKDQELKIMAKEIASQQSKKKPRSQGKDW